MHKTLYGICFDADHFCRFFVRGEEPKLDPEDVEIAERLGPLSEDNAEAVGDEVRKRYELKQLKREMARRAMEREDKEGDKGV